MVSRDTKECCVATLLTDTVTFFCVRAMSQSLFVREQPSFLAQAYRTIELEADVSGTCEQVLALPEAAPFATPVSDEVAPGYSSIVTRPMDLGTVRNGLHRREYAHTADAYADVRQARPPLEGSTPDLLTLWSEKHTHRTFSNSCPHFESCGYKSRTPLPTKCFSMAKANSRRFRC